MECLVMMPSSGWNHIFPRYDKDRASQASHRSPRQMGSQRLNYQFPDISVLLVLGPHLEKQELDWWVFFGTYLFPVRKETYSACDK